VVQQHGNSFTQVFIFRNNFSLQLLSDFWEQSLGPIDLFGTEGPGYYCWGFWSEKRRIDR
ncbi:MAG: hypothetical protein ACE1ZK_04610, partial [Nitrospirales bacterium]